MSTQTSTLSASDLGASTAETGQDGEFEHQRIPASRQLSGKYFLGSYAGEHVAGTEFVIGASLVALQHQRPAVGAADRQPLRRVVLGLGLQPGGGTLAHDHLLVPGAAGRQALLAGL